MAQADTLFVGGRVWTADPSVDAVAVRGGVIVGLGADALALRGAGTEVVELAAGTVLPGFRDGHVHALEGGAESLDCDLTATETVDDVLREVSTYAAAHRDPGWIVGYGYPPESLPGGVGHAAVLDAVTGDRPTALWSGDHHMVWVNTAALRMVGISDATPDPPRGTIVRDADGAAVGTLLEAAETMVQPHLPPRGRDTEAHGLELAAQRLAAAGIVWAQEASTPPERIAAYLHVAAQGRLLIDLDLAFRVEVDRWSDRLPDFLDARREVARAAAVRDRDGVPGRLTATTAKFFVDGVIEGGTGALLEPYCALPGQGHPGHDHGIMNWPFDELVEAACAVDAAGLQLHLHAIGDAAVRTALDVVEAVTARNGPRDRRPVTAHTHLVHPDDLARFRRLGVVANFEPLWAQPNEVMTELTEPRLGAERSRRQYPIGTLVRSGAQVSFGSDWPVSSYVPLAGIAVAVTRQTADRRPPEGWLARERIGLEQAIGVYTAGSAFQAGDDGAGRIAVGAPADLVMVGADVAEVPLRDLGDVPVLGTWRAGRRTCGDGATISTPQTSLPS
jgi:predicted amidohydrolase YtcJ